MSNEESLGCSNREVLNLLLNTDPRELMNSFQLNLMAPNSSTSYHIHNSSDTRGGNIERVSIVNNSNNLHSVPPVNYENFNSYYLQNSNGSNSDWIHFPMFEINRKIESIMSTKGDASLTHIKAKIDEQILSLSKKSPIDLNLTQSSDEGHLTHQNYINPCKTMTISMPNYPENRLHYSSKQKDNILVSENLKDSNEKEFFFGRNKNRCLLITNEIDKGEGSKVRTHGKRKRHFFFEKVTVPKESNKICGTDNQLMKKYAGPLIQSHDTNINIPGALVSEEAPESFHLQKVPQNDNLRIMEIEEYSGTSKTETTNTDSKRPSNSPKETTHTDSEPSSKWLERLRAVPWDPVPLNTKRFRKGDVSSSNEMQNLLARVVNYNKTISKNVQCSQADSYKENIWIKRWCKSKNKDALVLCEPENSKMTSEKFEAKQFPSLAAMALMGKQVMNFRPCKFQKKGSATVWKIDRI